MASYTGTLGRLMWREVDRTAPRARHRFSRSPFWKNLCLAVGTVVSNYVAKVKIVFNGWLANLQINPRCPNKGVAYDPRVFSATTFKRVGFFRFFSDCVWNMRASGLSIRSLIGCSSCIRPCPTSIGMGGMRFLGLLIGVRIKSSLFSC